MMVGTGMPQDVNYVARAAMGSTDASGGALRSNVAFGSQRPFFTGTWNAFASGRHGSGLGSGHIRANPGCGVGSGPSDTGCCVGGPEASCGGLGSACFEGAGSMVVTSDLTYVGEGRGNYNNAGYMYVGEGAGSLANEAIEIPYGCRVRPCVFLLLPLLLLPFLFLYLLQPVPAPAKPTAFGTCIGWGDPHVRTFDGARVDYYSSGEYHIVKNPLISVQGRYLPTVFTNGLAVTKMVAIGGSLLKGNTLIIGPLTATWNGAPILTEFPSHFNRSGLSVDYGNAGILVDAAINAQKKKIVHVKIADGTAEGITIQVNRRTGSRGNEYVNWKISMHSRHGQDGHCGNFNGNAVDDDRLAVLARLGNRGVPAGPELLFATRTPVAAADRPDINDCPTATLEAAKADCKATFGGMSPKMSCLTDYCFVGKEVALKK